MRMNDEQMLAHKRRFDADRKALAHKRRFDADRKALAMNKARARHALTVQAMARIAGGVR